MTRNELEHAIARELRSEATGYADAGRSALLGDRILADASMVPADLHRGSVRRWFVPAMVAAAAAVVVVATVALPKMFADRSASNGQVVSDLSALPDCQLPGFGFRTQRLADGADHGVLLVWTNTTPTTCVLRTDPSGSPETPEIGFVDPAGNRLAQALPGMSGNLGGVAPGAGGRQPLEVARGASVSSVVEWSADTSTGQCETPDRLEVFDGPRRTSVPLSGQSVCGGAYVHPYVPGELGYVRPTDDELAPCTDADLNFTKHEGPVAIGQGRLQLRVSYTTTFAGVRCRLSGFPAVWASPKGAEAGKGMVDAELVVGKPVQSVIVTKGVWVVASVTYYPNEQADPTRSTGLQGGGCVDLPHIGWALSSDSGSRAETDTLPTSVCDLRVGSFTAR